MESTVTPTKLYRHFDKDGVLLYVGISTNVVLRLSQHSKYSHWFDEITNVTIETYPSRDDALDAETKAIQTENPKYNIAKSKKPYERWSINIEEAMLRSRAKLDGEVINFGVMYTPTSAAHVLDISPRVINELIRTKKIGTVTIPAQPGLSAHGNPFKEKILITGWQLMEYVEHLMEKNT